MQVLERLPLTPQHSLHLVRVSGKTLLIGDGASDFCAADRVDFVFAKHRLIEHCRSAGIPYVPITSFADALAAAQAEGYAEADPTFDVDGIDAAHKLSILAALCFGTRLDFDTVTAEGIRGLIAADIREAAALGHRVRLIGMAERDESGLYQHVQPCLVPADHPLAYVPGALNAVVAEGNFVGRLFFEGAGAGAGPTASAIVADIIDIARDEYGPAFAMPVDALDAAPAADAGARVGKHYVRLIVEDRIGVLAEIATAMRDAGVSIESFIQRGDDAEDGVLIALVTHEGPGRAVAAALAALAASDHVIGTPMHMPILAL